MLLFSTLLLLLATIVIYCIINHVIKWRKLSYLTANMEGPRSLPFIGSILFLSGNANDTVDTIINLTQKYKSPWKIWLGGELFIVVTDPEDVETVLNKCLEKSKKYKFVKALLGEGLFTGPVDKWKKHRKVISTTFNLQILNSYVAAFSEHSVSLVETLRTRTGNGVFDVFPFMTQFSLEIICETIMGNKLNEKSEAYNYVQTLAKAMNVIYIRIFNIWLHPDFIWDRTSYSKKFDAMSQRLKKFIANITSEKQAEYQKNKSDNYIYEECQKRKSFLDRLIEICETTDKWTESDLMEEAQTMAAAGVESMGSIPSYTLMMIGMHPSVQDRVYNEVKEIFGNSDRPIDSTDLNRMTYLEQVIKETLRLFPIANAIGRYVDQDIQIKVHTIPKGCECLIGTLFIHRNPKIWKDPLKFNPDRFSPEEVAKRHPYSFLPFSAGPRNCIGSKFAMMAMKTVIASVVRNFEIWTDLTEVSEIRSKPGIVFKSAVGHRIALEERQK